MYLAEFILPSTLQIVPTPLKVIQLQIMTLNFLFTPGEIHSGNQASSLLRHIYTRQSVPITIWHSSEEITFFPFAVYRPRPFRHAPSYPLDFSLRRRIVFLQTHLLYPFCLEQRQIVFSDTHIIILV